MLGAVASVVTSVVGRRLDAAPLKAARASLCKDIDKFDEWARQLGGGVPAAPVAPAAPPAPATSQSTFTSTSTPGSPTQALRDAQGRFTGTRREGAIKAAQRTYLAKSLVLGLGVLTVAAATTTTVITAGGASPALVVSVLALRQAMANWKDARKNVKLLEGKKPPLPMGGNALANALYAQYTQDGMTEQTARIEAARNTLATGGLLAGLSLGLGFGAPVHAVEAARAVLATTRILQNGVTPATEAAVAYYGDEEIGNTVGSMAFESAAVTAWQNFFRTNPDRAAQYKKRLEANVLPNPLQLLPSRSPAHVNLAQEGASETDYVDLRPLIRWGRDTKQLDKFDDWLQVVDKQGRPTPWLDEIFNELQALDQGKDRLRGSLGLTAAATTASFVAASIKLAA